MILRLLAERGGPPLHVDSDDQSFVVDGDLKRKWLKEGEYTQLSFEDPADWVRQDAIVSYVKNLQTFMERSDLAVKTPEMRSLERINDKLTIIIFLITLPYILWLIIFLIGMVGMGK